MYLFQAELQFPQTRELQNKTRLFFLVCAVLTLMFSELWLLFSSQSSVFISHGFFRGGFLCLNTLSVI